MATSAVADGLNGVAHFRSDVDRCCLAAYHEKRKVSRREFMRHSAAWSQAVLEAEALYEASLAAEGGGSLQQQQQRDQQHVGVATLVAAAATIAATGLAHENRANGNDPTANTPNPSILRGIGGESAVSTTRFGGKQVDQVGTFLHRRVRDILREGTAERGGAASSGGKQGEGGNDDDGSIDEGILGYLMRKQRAVEGCDDLNGVSVAGYGMYEELEGGDVRIPGGFSRVVDALAGKVSRSRTLFRQGGRDLVGSYKPLVYGLCCLKVIDSVFFCRWYCGELCLFFALGSQAVDGEASR